MFSKFLKFLTILIVIIAGAGWSFEVLAENWEAPSATPPSNNRFRPINTSDLPQIKSGTLYLTDDDAALVVDGVKPLVFGYHPNSGNKYVGFKAPSSIDASVVWALPKSDGSSGSVLKTDGAGNLGWYNLVDMTTQDEDFAYKKNGSNNILLIGTKFFTKFLNSGSIDGNMVLSGEASPSKFTGGAGDVFIENRLEVDGITYLNNGLRVEKSSGNAEIDLQSVTGVGNHWGLYADATDNSLKFWQTDNQITFTNDGRVGIGSTKTSPAQALDVAGGIKLSGLIFDGAGSAGVSGQLLSRNASNIQWIDPTWWTGSGYIYSTQNTRIGNGGTIDQANGVGDLYIQNKLEVDGASYLKQVNATGLDLSGWPTGVIPFQSASGLAYNESNLFWDNTAKHLGLGTASPADFTLQVAGDVGPNTNNAYDLGSIAKRWRNIFANSINIVGGTLDLGFTQGSVVFQGNNSLAQNNNKFFWDNTNGRLGLGINTPTQTLDIAGNLKISDSSYDFSEGVIYSGNDLFIHGSIKSLLADQVSWADAEYSNTYVGRKAGSFVPVSYDSTDYLNDLYDNSALGFWALKNNQAGANTAIGSRALWQNTTGFGNSALGSFAASSGTSGSLNSSFGSYALASNSSGNYNTAIGANALKYNVASNNTAVGFNALKGVEGVIGQNLGKDNVALGSGAGLGNNAGDKNLFLGVGSGLSNTAGSMNIFAGYYAGELHSNGDNNVFMGNDAARGNTTGSFTVAVGSGSGYSSSGSKNIFLGYKAGYFETGSNKLYIEPSNADSNSALIYGEFFSTSVFDPMLRVNGKLALAPRGTATFTPNKLLHLYSPNSIGADENNAEIDIQSSSASGSHWGIYQERNSLDLKFWQNGDRVTFSNDGQVAIGGNIDSSYLLKVYGGLSVATSMAGDYRSSDNNQKGGTAYICSLTAAGTAVRVRYEDGLYICSCSAGATCPGVCTCSNP